MDINNLLTADIHEQGAEMQVLDPAGKPTDCYITLVGIDSETWQEISLDAGRRLLLSDSKPDEEEAVYTIVKATKGWKGFEQDGKPFEFNQKNAFLLYKKAPYIREQADRFIARRANFIRS